VNPHLNGSITLLGYSQKLYGKTKLTGILEITVAEQRNPLAVDIIGVNPGVKG